MKKHIFAIVAVLSITLGGLTTSGPAPQPAIAASVINDMKTKVARANDTSVKKMDIAKVTSLAAAKEYLNQHCPTLTISSRSSDAASYYVTGTNRILLSTHVPANRIPFVFAHELAHHYQYQYLKSDIARWDAGIRDKSLEREADYLAQIITGASPELGWYTQEKYPADQKAALKRIITAGKIVGC